MNDVLIYDNLVDQNMIKLIYKTCIESKTWFYGRSGKKNTTKFWGSFLYNPKLNTERSFIVDYLKERLETISGITPLNVRFGTLNGQTSNQKAAWHPDTVGDDDPDRLLTMIYYVNPTWNDNRGSTMIRLPNGEVKEIKFVPGRIICFPSYWEHYGDCPEQDDLLRITCAIKLEILKKK
jgi:hypothetical protein